jgi:hypothetical protein
VPFEELTKGLDTKKVYGVDWCTLAKEDGSKTVASPNATGAAALAVSTTKLASCRQGVAYSATLVATGGQPPFSWAISGGTLPEGLTLNPNTGVISGTHIGENRVKDETVRFIVQVKDKDHTATKELSLAINVVIHNHAMLMRMGGGGFKIDESSSVNNEGVIESTLEYAGRNGNSHRYYVFEIATSLSN